MEAVKHKDRSRLLTAANRQVPCDLTIGNAVIFDVFTGALTPGSVDIAEGVIVSVREGETEDTGRAGTYYDARGAILLPGFIDTHIHVESTMMIPEITPGRLKGQITRRRTPALLQPRSRAASRSFTSIFAMTE